MRMDALLHIGVDDTSGAMKALRRRRQLFAKSRATARGRAGSGDELGLGAAELEALMLACARQGRWAFVRWLLRATGIHAMVVGARGSFF